MSNLHKELTWIAGTKRIGTQQSEYFFVEDGSKVHSRKTTKTNQGFCNKARLECGIFSIDWPPKSPDLDPIEHCWCFIKQGLRNRKPHGRWTLPESTEAVMEIWAKELTQGYFNKWIDSMPERPKAVIARKGGVTK